jgi:hypothetical protein
VIVSASYRTDIPAFYSDWFRRRLAAGFCLVRNPYSGAYYKVPLARPECEAFVFWTKNLQPFLSVLPEVQARSFTFYVQYTITGYPRSLEPAVTDASRAIEHMHSIAGTYHRLATVWRYDTILFTSETPASFHMENFDRLAEQLEGATDEAVVSFAQIYRKTRRNLDAAVRLHHIQWSDPPDQDKHALLRKLAGIALRRGMRLTVCSQRNYLQPGVDEAACIDVERLTQLAGYRLRAARQGNRPQCACWASRDIGAYDTCPHGCVYCYAVETRAAARRYFQRHNPDAEAL